MTVPNKKIPTIFVHGYRGNDRSLHGMIRRFDQKYHWGTDSLTVHVSKEGEISTTGYYSKKQKNPLINIVFDNSHATLIQQSIWTKNALLFFKKNEHINEFNAVGHSMGGGTWTAYLATYEKNPDVPRVKNIIFLGVPLFPEEYINGAEPAVLKNTEQLHQRFAKKVSKAIPKDVNVLIIGGDLKNGTKSDGVVNLSSVLYGKKLFPYQKVQTKIIRGNKATHSNLHELPAIDYTIAKFLFK